eukprot:gene24728-biopygen2936
MGGRSAPEVEQPFGRITVCRDHGWNAPDQRKTIRSTMRVQKSNRRGLLLETTSNDWGRLIFSGGKGARRERCPKWCPCVLFDARTGPGMLPGESFGKNGRGGTELIVRTGPVPSAHQKQTIPCDMLVRDTYDPRCVLVVDRGPTLHCSATQSQPTLTLQGLVMIFQSHHKDTLVVTKHVALMFRNVPAWFFAAGNDTFKEIRELNNAWSK